MCVSTFLYIYTHIYAYSFVFSIFPSVKTFVSRLEQTPGDVSEQRRILRNNVEFADAHKPQSLVLTGGEVEEVGVGLGTFLYYMDLRNSDG